MLVPQDSQNPKGKEESPVSVQYAEAPPPAYEQPQVIAPPTIKAANYISVIRRLGEIKETFVLDPTLQLPLHMKPSNDKLHLNISALLGEVDADVYVVGTGTPQSGKTRIRVSSTLGTTKLVLRAPHSQSRAPMAVSVRAHLGEVNLLLPRSFRGPLRMSAALGDVTLSKGLRAASTKFGDNQMFVGEWSQAETGEAVWSGDEAHVESTMGTVYVGYDDETKKS
ncbi:hypothetical protein GGX14DRAFT_514210 [Mycena pura]|uniref:DUF7330 domain-containing protein n=1 Tax=Mycena pura TaxID=153505 RepID=A0AAD6YL59_9AGAR|nr:hypothetical protein GGX14DRAFT_514210 [Mycena pura]